MTKYAGRYTKEWYQRYKDSYAKYYKKNIEKLCARSRKWHKDHPKERRIIRMRTYWKNKEVENEKSRAYTFKRKLLVLHAYGGKHPKCKRCPVDDVRLLELDHIYNDGAKHRREVKAIGAGFYGWIIRNNYPNKKRYQILCKNCNHLKYYTLSLKEKRRLRCK